MSRRAALALGLAGVAAAAGARTPVIRRWPASILQAVPCALASEAPTGLSVVHAVAGLAALRGVWGPGPRAGRPAAIAAALANVAAVAALADLRRDADRSAAAFDSALSVMGADPPGATPPARPWSHLRSRDLRRHVDVAYGEDPAQLLDVWSRPDPGPGAPVLVQVHGGGWTGGDKLGPAEPLLAHMAEQGWVCVSVNYRLAPAQRWPTMITDVKRALAWVRSDIAAYGGDPGFVAITGGSAGGHLAALAALTPGDPDFQPGFADADTSVAAAVPLYGVHDLTVDDGGLFALLEGKVIGTTLDADGPTWRAGSPVHRAGPDAPPFLVVHGSTDTIVNVAQSRRLVRRLREVSRSEVCYAELPRAQHGFDTLATARTRITVRAVHRFLAAVHARYRAAAPSTAAAARNGAVRPVQAATGASSSAPASSS